MEIVLITALGVGLSSVIGSLLSFWIKEIPQKVSDAILSSAAGIMLGATFLSLIIPSIELSGDIWGYMISGAGIFAGGVVICLVDKLVPHLHKIIKVKEDSENLNRVLLFVAAIGIHYFPEGLAVGVSFGNENIGNAISIAAGISLHHIPAGLVTILPLILAGVSKKKAFLIALITGLIEVVGVMLGYLAVGASSAVLPFILAVAGGAMLYVITSEMIPETHSHGHEKTAAFSLIGGVVVMLLINAVFGD